MKGFWLGFHRWVGLKLSILMSFVLITGTFATVSHEIDWLIDPARRVPVSQAPTTLDWQGLVDAATQARPTWSIEWVGAPIDPWFAVEVVGINDQGALRRLFIHPATLEVQGEGAWFNAQRLFRDSHRRLMIFTVWGIIIVSSLSILMLLSLITGLIVYKKFWRGFFKWPRTRDARTLWGDLHRLTGLWSIWFIVIIALTGLWYLIEAGGAVIGQRVARPTFETVAASDQELNTVDLTALSRRARQSIPGFRITSVFLPKYRGQPITFHGQASAILVRPRANQVRFDSETDALLGVARGETMSIMQRVGEMADPLHFGTFGGFATKLIYFVFGVLLSGMSLSGVYIFSIRIRNADAKRAARAQAPESSGGAHA